MAGVELPLPGDVRVRAASRSILSTLARRSRVRAAFSRGYLKVVDRGSSACRNANRVPGPGSSIRQLSEVDVSLKSNIGLAGTLCYPVAGRERNGAPTPEAASAYRASPPAGLGEERPSDPAGPPSSGLHFGETMSETDRDVFVSPYNEVALGRGSGRRIRIFDTTLRDGEQMPGVALSAPDKVHIATLLDHLGGGPVAGPP